MLDRIDQPSDRRQDILHPSEMAHSDWCPRQSNYRLSGAKETNAQKNHGVVLENIFDEGHQIHDKWQRRMWDMGRLWGKWECIYCLHTWFATSPKVCDRCGGPKTFLRYKEVPLSAEETHLISGHEDGAIPDLNALVEVKSIGQGTLRMEDPTLLRENHLETVDGGKVYDLDGIWKNLKRPLPGHLRQTSIYAAIAQMMGLPYDRIIFIYEYKSNQQVKEFNVKYSPRIAEPLLDKALDIKYALSKGTIVSRPAGLHEENKICKACPFLSLCYSADGTPSDQTPEAEGREQLGSRRSLGSRRGAPVGAGHRPSRPTGGDHPKAPARSDRVGRQRPDDVVHEPDGVGGVLRGSPSSGRGRREIRRRTPRSD